MEHYLDNAATTKVCDEAAQAALAAMTENYGNPSSTHTKGREANRLLEKARYHFDAERCTSLDEAIGLARANSRRGLLICGSEAIALEAEQKLEAR